MCLFLFPVLIQLKRHRSVLERSIREEIAQNRAELEVCTRKTAELNEDFKTLGGFCAQRMKDRCRYPEGQLGSFFRSAFLFC